MEGLTKGPKITALAAKCLANNLKYDNKNGEGAKNFHRPERKKAEFRTVKNQWGFKRLARVVKLADTPDLKSVERKACAGSSPAPRTKTLRKQR